MKKISVSALALAALLVSGTALAFSCPAGMEEIDFELANDPDVSGAELMKVKELRAQAEAFHKAGNHSDSVGALDDARELLGID